jgi:lysozyme
MTTIWPDYARVCGLAEPLILKFEGFRPKPYLCPAGVPTIGIGTTRYPDGRKVTLADLPCSEGQAQAFLQSSMWRVYQDLQNSGAVTRSPTLHQAAAFLSLAYNIGVGVHDGRKGDLADSSLLDCFNRGDLNGAWYHFLDWDKAHVQGILQRVQGLVARRMAEQQLFKMAD